MVDQFEYETNPACTKRTLLCCTQEQLEQLLERFGDEVAKEERETGVVYNIGGNHSYFKVLISPDTGRCFLCFNGSFRFGDINEVDAFIQENLANDKFTQLNYLAFLPEDETEQIDVVVAWLKRQVAEQVTKHGFEGIEPGIAIEFTRKCGSPLERKTSLHAIFREKNLGDEE